HVGPAVRTQRLYEQEARAVVGRDLPRRRIAHGNVLDPLVVGKLDRRLDSGFADYSHDLVRIIGLHADASVRRAPSRGAGKKGQSNETRSNDHRTISREAWLGTPDTRW